MSELDGKLNRVQALLQEQGLDALLLQRVENFAWATCGAPAYIDIAVANGEASLLITRSDRFLITNNIEALRLGQEEGLNAQGWQLRSAPWFEKNGAIAQLTTGLRLGADGPYPGATDVCAAVSRLRHQLTGEEIARFRKLSDGCKLAMDHAVRSILPGMTEYEIAGMLAAEAYQRGVVPTVNLVATDERIYSYRHPLPKDKALDRYAMIVLCGRSWGLVCSLTRLVYFGKMPDALRRKAEACAQIDAKFIAATRPGRKLSDVFADAVKAYASAGFPNEWQLHHQGGLAGYLPREVVATPSTDEKVSEGQVYAWNPSITGTKSEDTILTGPVQNEVLTAITGWPMMTIEVDGQSIERPKILELT